MKKNLYQILGVHQNASQSMIDIAYKELCEKHQALYDQGSQDASLDLFNIKGAYETLSNPDKRSAYDEKLASLHFNQPHQKISVNVGSEQKTPTHRSESQLADSSNSALVKCKTCGHEISKHAATCPHCGEQITQVQNQMPDILPYILGLTGSVVLFIGVFMPIVSIPIAGNLNYFQNGKGDGVIIVLLAVVSFVFTLSNKFRWLWLTGCASLAVLLFTFMHFQIKLGEMKGSMDSQLTGNPFRGLADAAMQTIQLQWGWAILVIGAAFLMAAAATKPLNKQSATKASLALVVALTMGATGAWLTADKKTKTEYLESSSNPVYESGKPDYLTSHKLDTFTVNLSDGESYLQTDITLTHFK